MPNWIGDVVMATPMLRALRDHFGPQATIVGVMRPYVRDVLAGSNWIDDTILFNPHDKAIELRCRSAIRQLRSAKLDCSILATNSLRTAFVALAARIPQRVGYVRYGRGPLLTKRLRPPRVGRRLAPVSAVDYYAQLATAVGTAVPEKRLQLATTPRGDALADQIWQRYHLTQAGRPVVSLSTGAAYGAAKEWPIEYLAELAHKLATEQAVSALVLCGPAERNAARRIVELAGHPHVFSLADEPVSIELSKSVIKRCCLLISNDSGPRHIAAAFNIPTVTLFGPTDPRWSHNFHPQSINLQRHVPCGPCAKRSCPLMHHRCMRELTVGQVYSASRKLLPQSAWPADRHTRQANQSNTDSGRAA